MTKLIQDNTEGILESALTFHQYVSLFFACFLFLGVNQACAFAVLFLTRQHEVSHEYGLQIF